MIENVSIFCFAFKVDIAKVLNDVFIALLITFEPKLCRYRESLNKTGLDLDNAFNFIVQQITIINTSSTSTPSFIGLTSVSAY